MASESPSVDVKPCLLLRIPKELRFIIYRQLLFPQTRISIMPLIPIDEIHGSSSDEEWTSSEDSYPNTDDELEEMMFPYGNPDFYMSGSEVPFGCASTEEYQALKRHPAILRTNRQIFEEASSLLYTEAVLVVEPGDIFCLRKKPFDLPFGNRNPNPWRHNPLRGTGRLTEEGVVRYEQPEMKDGHMEPHVFARFQKINFAALFDLDHTQHVELWIDDETHVIPQDDVLAYKRVLDSSHLMKDFVKILARSPRISNLEISLEVDIMAISELMLEDIPDDLDEAEEKETKADRLMDIASEKATEIFLDSKICEPLVKLSNVQTFNFGFGFETREDDEKYDPPKKYLEMFRKMKKHIEGEFKEPRDRRRSSSGIYNK